MHIFEKKHLPSDHAKERWKQHSIAILYQVALIGFFVLLPLSIRVRGEKRQGDTMEYNTLTTEDARVIIDKGTEPSFIGEFYKHKEAGICE